jgi:CheY-like chemotaxis protein
VRIAEPARHNSPHLPSEASDAAPVILVVEDDRYVRDRIVRVLSTTGERVMAVADPGAALRLAQANAPIDVLITDWALPGVDGLELARRLRSRHRSLATVVVSGFADAAAACDRTGALFVRKPFTADDLVEAVHTAREHPPGEPPAGSTSSRSGSPRPRPS